MNLVLWVSRSLWVGHCESGFLSPVSWVQFCESQFHESGSASRFLWVRFSESGSVSLCVSVRWVGHTSLILWVRFCESSSLSLSQSSLALWVLAWVHHIELGSVRPPPWVRLCEFRSVSLAFNLTSISERIASLPFCSQCYPTLAREFQGVRGDMSVTTFNWGKEGTWTYYSFHAIFCWCYFQRSWIAGMLHYQQIKGKWKGLSVWLNPRLNLFQNLLWFQHQPGPVFF